MKVKKEYNLNDSSWMWNTYNTMNSIKNNVSKPENKKLAAFNVLMFDNINKYEYEKDMPDDIYIKYCKFRNRVEDLIGE